MTGSPVAAQQLLGHKSIQTTMAAYIRQNPTEARRVLKMLEAKIAERQSNGESGGAEHNG